jgi:hypothetical protein
MGSEAVVLGEPTHIAPVNSWVSINVGGSPTYLKGVTAESAP